jgi:propionyl-CoA carboxylase beta chain
VRSSGVIPQISAILGPCAGGAVYSPALTDFVMMVENTSYMFVTGPNVVKTVTHEEVSREDLGGASHPCEQERGGALHRTQRAGCHPAAAQLISYIPSNCEEEPPAFAYEPGDESRPELDTIIPENPNQPYDIREVMNAVIDPDSSMEVHAEYARNMVVGFARVAGRTVGCVANQPATCSPGVLDIDASIKAARFVRFCDAFNIPLARVRGRARLPARHRPGVARHHRPRRQAALRLQRGHGAAHHRDHPQSLWRRLRCDEQQTHRCDMNFAWPSAEIAVMGAKGAAEIIFKNEIAKAARTRRQTGRRRRPSTRSSSPTRTKPQRAATWMR